MSDPPAPPTSHVLRPHHIQLLTLLLVAFTSFDEKTFSQPFLLALYRFALQEISEVSFPKTYGEICKTLRSAPMADAATSRQFLQVFLVSCRRSLFGYFARRCFVSYLKLSYGGLARLHRDYLEWVAAPVPGPSSASGQTLLPGYRPIQKVRLAIDYQILKTQADRREYADPDPWRLWQHAYSTGDENLAQENLRRYFEQRFNDSKDSGLRQHALLHIARMHYLSHEYDVCRKLLQEAIGVARTSNDRVVLQLCISMLRRLPPEERSRKPALNEVQPDLHPLEILSDVRKLMPINHLQPLSAAFEKIVQAVGLYDHWIDAQGAAFVESEQWGQHAVQSVVWSMHGCLKLAHIEEDIVTAFTEVGGNDNNRLIVTLNRAYYRARQGDYQHAIASLLDPDVWRGLDMNDYYSWASEIWHILVLRSSRRGQKRQFSEFLKQKRPNGPYAPREYWSGTSTPLGSIIRDPLYEIIQMRGVDQAHTGIEMLLTALWHAEFQGRYGLYRTAIILLADVGLEFGMTKWCRRILEEIMPQIIAGNELEQRALALFTLARCMLAASDSLGEDLARCLPLLAQAEHDFQKLEMLRQLQDVRYLISVVYHNLGMSQQRDIYAARVHEAEVQAGNASTVVIEDWIVEVWEIVAEVGAALASR
ncbi:hypothetical protein CERSUDRAFT_82798 [Gelatoporia subvermispora B]|uniref:Anaphase-promoting complex subunit 5 n=1 Tax=Ceriporiopsis subvermispora (strain B) TaxID=914234 RepID=M2RIA7_CERS8|nr:hypothetical protein CERSUDRAFT_82798 [Gelatoporia subvermispora B]